MKKIETGIKDLYIIEIDTFGDNRGWFSESFNQEKFNILGFNYNFIQDNHSFSASKHTLRGLHFQLNPKGQTKLVRCTRGKILDVAVDLRKGSPTYLTSFSVELSEENKRQLLIPVGFAHGFLTLTDNVEVQYKVDNLYSKEHDRSIRYDEKSFNIKWNVVNPILSEKDLNAPYLDASDVDFKYEENEK